MNAFRGNFLSFSLLLLELVPNLLRTETSELPVTVLLPAPDALQPDVSPKLMFYHISLPNHPTLLLNYFLKLLYQIRLPELFEIEDLDGQPRAMSDERLPEENLFTVLLVILSHLFTMVFSVLFVVFLVVFLLTHLSLH